MLKRNSSHRAIVELLDFPTVLVSFLRKLHIVSLTFADKLKCPHSHRIWHPLKSVCKVAELNWAICTLASSDSSGPCTRPMAESITGDSRGHEPHRFGCSGWRLETEKQMDTNGRYWWILVDTADTYAILCPCQQRPLSLRAVRHIEDTRYTLQQHHLVAAPCPQSAFTQNTCHPASGKQPTLLMRTRSG